MKGFTFIELILVLAIILVLAAISVAFYSRFLTQNAVINNTDQIVSLLRKAQTYSMTGKQNGGDWGVKYASTPTKQITLYLNGNSAFDEDFTVNNNITISPDPFDVSFLHFTGIPQGATFPLDITISGNNQTKSITVNAQGVVNRN